MADAQLTDTDFLAALPVAVYATDAEGSITFYNDAAAHFWGKRPAIGTSQWRGLWRLYWPDGRRMAQADCPMALTLKEGRPVRGEAIAERPNGTRVRFAVLPTLLTDENGRIAGAINVLIDVDGRYPEIELERLAAIVSSSDDAIISKTLDGRVTSWNAGATRIFGYRADEMIGEPITRIIPRELHKEEEEILAKLRRGERIEHFETVRVTKDGRHLDISLTVSPLRNRAGIVVGASKVGRDITERKRNEELKRLLFDELNHRVKNTLAMVQSIATQSLRTASSPEQFVASFNGRIHSLARAHDLLVQGGMKGASLIEIVREQVLLDSPDAGRISCSGPSIMLNARLAVQLALVLHELATNARKHGALAVAGGRISISWELRIGAERELCLEWVETGVPEMSMPRSSGFGMTLVERSCRACGGEGSASYGAEGLNWKIRLPLPALAHDQDVPVPHASKESEPAKGPGLHGSETAFAGKRILVVEDEVLVGMEIECQLIEAGFEVIGPAANVQSAKRLIAEVPMDAALVDRNLNGVPSDEVTAALARNGIPFAVATGYGPEALPLVLQDAPLLTKPVTRRQLLETVRLLLERHRDTGEVVPIRPKKA